MSLNELKLEINEYFLSKLNSDMKRFLFICNVNKDLWFSDERTCGVKQFVIFLRFAIVCEPIVWRLETLSERLFYGYWRARWLCAHQYSQQAVRSEKSGQKEHYLRSFQMWPWPAICCFSYHLLRRYFSFCFIRFHWLHQWNGVMFFLYFWRAFQSEEAFVRI